MSFVLNPVALDQLLGESTMKSFIRQVLFYTQGQSIRFVAHEQFFAIATKATGKPGVITFFTMFLFDIVQNSAREIPQHSRDAFHLLCNLLRYSSGFQIPLPKYEQLLQTQIDWLRQAKDFIKSNSEGCVQEELLEGHICVARDLIGFLDPEKKYLLGCDPEGNSPLIRVCYQMMMMMTDVGMFCVSQI